MQQAIERVTDRARPNAVKRAILAGALLLGAAPFACAAEPGRPDAGADRRVPCTIEVLQSEELPGAPIFNHHLRAVLRVTLPDRAPFETTVERIMPWQVPPPRRGQRLQMLCDPATMGWPAFY
ncbi:hypothetical protein [Bradyrhizobium sp. NP1]|uniref:hypothetical protein n=1 Tax=Bradyrhizobium sp. NP1 TaxID=3049772 RepID=UPI0025A538BF|nr:hypothetical protein [Bradyrhizobium sp. NP1]WJR75797.1 hypothetical protein QOU61_23820 [Bradyrhizobium sp. NP1]